MFIQPEAHVSDDTYLNSIRKKLLLLWTATATLSSESFCENFFQRFLQTPSLILATNKSDLRDSFFYSQSRFHLLLPLHHSSITTTTDFLFIYFFIYGLRHIFQKFSSGLPRLRPQSSPTPFLFRASTVIIYFFNLISNTHVFDVANGGVKFRKTSWLGQVSLNVIMYQHSITSRRSDDTHDMCMSSTIFFFDDCKSYEILFYLNFTFNFQLNRKNTKINNRYHKNDQHILISKYFTYFNFFYIILNIFIYFDNFKST